MSVREGPAGRSVRERLGDEARIAAGRLVQLGDPERCELGAARAARAVRACQAPSRPSGSSDDASGTARRRHERRRQGRRRAGAGSRARRASWSRPTARSSRSSTSGPCSPTSATSASSTSTSSNSAPRRIEGELGQDLSRARAVRRASSVDAGERVAERRRERHVRQMPLELRAARAPDADVVELAHELVEQSRLAEPRFALDLDQREVPVERPRTDCGRACRARSSRPSSRNARAAASRRARGSDEGAASGRPPGG